MYTRTPKKAVESEYSLLIMTDRLLCSLRFWRDNVGHFAQASVAGPKGSPYEGELVPISRNCMIWCEQAVSSFCVFTSARFRCSHRACSSPPKSSTLWCRCAVFVAGCRLLVKVYENGTFCVLNGDNVVSRGQLMCVVCLTLSVGA